MRAFNRCYTLLQFLIFTSINISHVDGATRSGATTGASELYEFEAPHCPTNTFPSTVNVLPSPSHTLVVGSTSSVLTCPGTSGISSLSSPPSDTSRNTLRSSQPMSSLLSASASHATPKGLSFELWLKPRATGTPGAGGVAQTTIFSISDPNLAADSTANYCDADGYYDLRLVHWENRGSSTHLEKFVFEYKDRAGLCVQLTSGWSDMVMGGGDGVEADGPFVHIALTLGSSKETMFVNKVNVRDHDSENGSFDHNGIWDSTYKYNFFSDGYPSVDTFKGSLLLFSSYPFELTSVQVAANYDAGLATSFPVVVSETVSVNEDAEGNPNSHPVSWYREQQPVAEVVAFELSLLDLDSESALPGYDAEAPNNEIRIHSLPAKGELFNEDGSALDEVNDEVVYDATNDRWRVKYRPDLNGNTVAGEGHDSFEVYAVDGSTGGRSVGNSLITLNVAPVNDPPFAFTWLNATIQSGVLDSSVLTLSGFDIDAGQTVSTFIVTSLPSKGTLHQVDGVGNFVTEALSLNADTGEAEVSHSGGKVGYKYTGSETEVTGEGKLGDDSFQFKVKDNSGVVETDKSEAATFSLQVFTALFADRTTNVAEFTATEEVLSNTIKLRGHDAGEVPRTLKFQIASLPSHGSLFDIEVSTTEPLSVSSIVSTPLPTPHSSSHVLLGYKGSENYFNFPSTRANSSSLNLPQDSFSYRAVVASNAAIKSLPVTQEVRVTNVNDGTTLAVPTEQEGLKVYAFSTLNPSDCGGDNAELDECQFGDELLVDGIRLTDVDLDLDKVVVRVSSDSGGTMTLNSEYKEKADFLSCLRHLTSWACGSSNDGTADDRITFVATPYDANDILKQLKYTNLEPNIIDTITVSVFDGSGGLCIDEEDHTTPSVRLAEGEEVCLTSRLSFNITVDTFSFQKNSDGNEWDSFLPFGIKLTYQMWLGVMGGCLVLMCCLCSILKRKLRRRSDRKRERKRKRAKAKEKLKKKGKKEKKKKKNKGKKGKKPRENSFHERGSGFSDDSSSSSDSDSDSDKDIEMGKLNISTVKGFMSKGLDIGSKGLEKVDKLGVGGPATKFAMKGVNFAKKTVDGDGGNENPNLPPPPPKPMPPTPLLNLNLPPPQLPMLSGKTATSTATATATVTATATATATPPEPPSRAVPPPPPPKKNESEDWIAHEDESGDKYYENVKTERTTWTKP